MIEELQTTELHSVLGSQIYFLSFLQYTGAVDENVHDVVVMRIKAVDKDLKHSDNWLTVFHIIKGNEDNLFSIETDPMTNEGVLKLIKVFQLKTLDFTECFSLIVPA